MSRGNKVFAVPRTLMKQTTQHPTALVRDILLHSLFGRLALSDGSNVELQTTYDNATGTIDIEVPEHAAAAFNQISGMQRGPNLIKFINWLIGSQTIVGSDIKDPNFIPSTELKIWKGAKIINYSGVHLVLQFPNAVEIVIGHNFRLPDSRTETTLTINLVWMFIAGSNFTLPIRSSINIIRNGTPAAFVQNVMELDALGLSSGDIVETTIVTSGAILEPGDIIGVLIERNYADSPDPQTESIGVLGIGLQLDG